jgi:hypothetical protein
MPIVVITIVASLWITAQSQELQAEVQRGTWGALPLQHPERLPAFVSKKADQNSSLQKVLLKDNKVVGMR